jgi:uncharacterized metal-binding protein
MRAIVSPLPVLYSCQGCPQFGQLARDVGAFFEQAGALEMVWLGDGRKLEATQRYPVLALDGCKKACAVRWLEERGIVPESAYVLPGIAE